MNGLVHLLDLAGATIAQLQAENARLGKQIEALRKQAANGEYDVTQIPSVG